MSNFFNAIGVADMEKVHSAMIAWILDDKNDSNMSGENTGSLFSTFDLDTRSDLLCDIFGEPRKKFVSIETFVEWNDIDILILTKDKKGTEECWVIENKLKSPEHVSNVKGSAPIWQTQKYTQTITNTFGTNVNHYLLLSLTGDSAKSPIGNWRAKKYEDLRNILSKYHTASLIIREYYNAIDKLCDVLNDFLVNNLNYPIAISSKTKNSEKSKVLLKSKNTNEKYVIENSLETIFQKSLLIKQMEQYKKNKNNPCYNCNYTTSASSNGIAVLDILYGDFKDTTTNEKYHAQFEFQDGSFKVQIHQLHKKSSKAFYGWIPVFYNVERRYKSNGWSVNPIKNRLYISISKKVQWQRQDIQSLWSTEFGICCQILTDLIKEFDTRHSTQLVPVP